MFTSTNPDKLIKQQYSLTTSKGILLVRNGSLTTPIIVGQGCTVRF
jgi:hypothetical protein